tara:strand:- start:33 stop:236 length:204 start_codon:yes stop_codon:yes gene_type:complete
MNKKLAFIGGSGIYKLDILTDVVEHDLVSSFGNPSSKIIEGRINGNLIFFFIKTWARSSFSTFRNKL